MKRAMTLVLAALVAVAALGCASRSRWAECESHLTPINKPLPATPAEPRP